MKSWIVSIIGIVFISILIDLLIGKSKNEKYIKEVFALISLYIIIFPIISLISKIKNEDIEIENIYIDKGVISSINQDRKVYYENEIEKNLKILGYDAICQIYLENNENFDVKKVVIILQKMDIEKEYKDIKEYIYNIFPNAIIAII